MSAGDKYLKWKQRAEQAERLAEQRKGGITQLTAQLNESVARAEQAERERDELRRMLHDAAPDTYQEVASALSACLEDGPRFTMAKHARQMETRAREEKAAREHAEKERDAARESADDWKTCYERAEAANAALLEQLRTLEAVIQKFHDAEWARGDWQGVCPFRRHKDVLCPGTDGRVAAVGTPSPVPHAEGCPYHALNALKERKP